MRDDVRIPEEDCPKRLKECMGVLLFSVLLEEMIHKKKTSLESCGTESDIQDVRLVYWEKVQKKVYQLWKKMDSCHLSALKNSSCTSTENSTRRAHMGKSKSRYEDGETPTQLGLIGKGVTKTKAAVVGWMVLLVEDKKKN